MAVDEKMSVDERYKYLRMMQKRYKKADRKGKSELLEEMEAVTGQHRKHLIRQMNGPLERQRRRRERGRTYGPEVRYALGVIAESLDHICAERLQPNLVWMAQHLVTHGELVVSADLLEKLGRISVSTVRRLLAEQPRACRAPGHDRPTGWRARFPPNATPGSCGSRDTLRSTWCITVE